jgi:hypothetical protein
MTFPVVVVLGAGASLGCASHGPSGNERDPPLVTDLFDGEPRIKVVLSQYPRAAAAGAEIRRRRNPRAVEDFIRERFKDSDNAIDQLKFLSIPYYLQELLFRVSHGYTRDPNNYDVLIAGLLRLPTQVLFVTMNYDTLLDDRLHAVAGELERLDDYVRPEHNWALIKLHGSITWVRRIATDDSIDPFSPTFDPKLIDDTILLRRENDIGRLRSEGTTHYFPALSVPVGAADEMNCPPFHVDFLRQALGRAEGIHLLVIGYSGHDREVLELLRESATSVKSLTVVNHDYDAAGATKSTLHSAARIPAVPGEAHDGDLNGYIQGSGFDQYLEWLDAAVHG